MLDSTTVPNLINGVSQQAEALRYPSQVDEQINADPSVVDGLSKRPPLEHIKELLDVDDLQHGLFSHIYKRDQNEQYVVLVYGSPIQVRAFDFEGNELPVNDPDGHLDYLSGADLSKDLKALTVADYTYILNTKTNTALASDTTATRNPEGILFLRQSALGADYTIELFNDPTSNTPTYSATLDSAGTDDARGDYEVGPASETITPAQGVILNTLLDLLPSGADTDYNITRTGPYAHVERADGSDFKIRVESTLPDGFFAFKDKVQSYALLPKQGWNGFEIKVAGDPDTDDDDYYVRFVPASEDESGSVFTDGSWEQTVAQDVEYKIDPDTMPIALVSSGTDFDVVQPDWSDRLVGDDDSNPKPSFIGYPIDELFFTRNRLGLLSDGAVVLSETGSYYNFWRTDVRILLDTDVVDIGSIANGLAKMTHAVDFSRSVTFWASDEQFILDSGEFLSPRTAAIYSIGKFENLSNVRPAKAGNTIMFPFQRTDKSGLGVFYRDDSGVTFDGGDLSKHVPTYLDGNIRHLAASDRLEKAILLTDGFAGAYVFDYLRQGRQRLQEAWHKFTFGADVTRVHDAYFWENELYFLVERELGLFLERMDFTKDRVDDYHNTQIHLDRRTEFSYTGTYDILEDTTEIPLPYTFSQAVSPVLIAKGVAGEFLLDVVEWSPSSITVVGDWRTATVVAGQKFDMRVDLSKPLLKPQGREGSTFYAPARFSVSRGRLTYANASSFEVRVSVPFKPGSRSTFRARQTGAVGDNWGDPLRTEEGTFSFPVMAQGDRVRISIFDDSVFSCSFLMLDYEGRIRRTSRRL